MTEVGCDIIEIERIEKAIGRHGQKFLDRIFTKKEQNYCLKHRYPARHFAGRFAAKEAISKAVGTGIVDTLTWLDIEIINDANGKPVVEFSKEAGRDYKSQDIALSISHCHDYAMAMAIYNSPQKSKG